MSEPIRSYQRIFRPERRIYQIEGRPLPVPGGVPLRCLAYAIGTLLAVLILGSGSTVVLLAAGALAGLAGFRIGGTAGAAVAASAAGASAWLAGEVLSVLDWPLRLLVLPAAVATIGTQATPDGRRADRFARSWVSLRLAPKRRSLARAFPPLGAVESVGGELWVSPDEGSTGLRPALVRGPAVVCFGEPVTARRRAMRHRRMTARPQARGGQVAAGGRRFALAAGETMEVRP